MLNCTALHVGARRVACAAGKRMKKDVMQVSVPSYAPALMEVPTILSDAPGEEVRRDTETIDWGLEVIGVDDMWRHSRGKGIKVAVLDTGVDLQHPDLRGNIVAAKDFTGGRTAQDKQGHGTHCAGIGAFLPSQWENCWRKHAFQLCLRVVRPSLKH